MQTDFSVAQLEDPAMASSEAVIRKCVHCGFCTATCPTYVLLGDELDSPRGRIYLIKDMLENERTPTAETVKHIDRCLSCLACMTTCPSGVNYMHLVDHARVYIERHYRRPILARAFRSLLARLLPYPERFRPALQLARPMRAVAKTVGKIPGLKPAAAMLSLTPARVPSRSEQKTSPVSAPKGRVAVLQGCVEQVLGPEIRAAAVRVLNRAGYDVPVVEGEGCCGALAQHLGRGEDALAAARRNVDAWARQIEREGLDAIIVTASGCGTMVKDYGFLLRGDPAYAARAGRVSALARDISEFLRDAHPLSGKAGGLTVAYHGACSLQHGQRVTQGPVELLRRLGFAVRTPAEAHLCCGSAGTYNILQSDISDKLGVRKAAALDALQADVIATGNIGCAVQIGRWTRTPVVHVAELIDWATGGSVPASLLHALPDRRLP